MKFWIVAIFLLSLGCYGMEPDGQTNRAEEQINKQEYEVVSFIPDKEERDEQPFSEGPPLEKLSWKSKICWVLGYWSGKSLSFCNSDNFKTEGPCGCCACGLATTSLLVFPGGSGITSSVLLCVMASCPDEGMAACLPGFESLTLASLGCCACMGCVAGTYVCCDSCGYQSCPEGFREGYICHSDHTCGPAGCDMITNQCCKAWNALAPCGKGIQFIGQKIQIFFTEIMFPLCVSCGSSCKNKCSDAFNSDR